MGAVSKNASAQLVAAFLQTLDLFPLAIVRERNLRLAHGKF
jgi:hypothetical protein